MGALDAGFAHQAEIAVLAIGGGECGGDAL
jgi:hypothetical protein